LLAVLGVILLKSRGCEEKGQYERRLKIALTLRVPPLFLLAAGVASMPPNTQTKTKQKQKRIATYSASARNYYFVDIPATRRSYIGYQITIR